MADDKDFSGQLWTYWSSLSVPSSPQAIRSAEMQTCVAGPSPRGVLPALQLLSSSGGQEPCSLRACRRGRQGAGENDAATGLSCAISPTTGRTEPCPPLQRHQGHQPASHGALVHSGVTCLSNHCVSGLWPLSCENPKSHI